MTPRRGEIWLVDFGEPIGREQDGRQPALVISDDELNEGPSGLAIVVPITSVRRGLPSHVELDGAGTGLAEVSYAKCEDVKSISDRRFIARLGVAPLGAVFGAERALRFLLGL
jgi:mRNA interferase MazF